MSVIIDQFELIMDSQNDQENGRAVSSSNTEMQQQSVLKPYTVETVLDYLQSRHDRVRAH